MLSVLVYCLFDSILFKNPNFRRYIPGCEFSQPPSMEDRLDNPCGAFNHFMSNKVHKNFKISWNQDHHLSHSRSILLMQLCWYQRIIQK